MSKLSFDWKATTFYHLNV